MKIVKIGSKNKVTQRGIVDVCADLVLEEISTRLLDKLAKALTSHNREMLARKAADRKVRRLWVGLTFVMTIGVIALSVHPVHL